MEILRIVGLALLASIFIVLLRQQRPEIAIQLSLTAGVIIFMLIIGKIWNVLQILEELASRANINQFFLSTILRIVGVAYIAEFGAQVCRDAGENAVATRVEFAAKILVMVLAMPIIVAVLESVIRLLPR